MSNLQLELAHESAAREPGFAAGYVHEQAVRKRRYAELECQPFASLKLHQDIGDISEREAAIGPAFARYALFGRTDNKTFPKITLKEGQKIVEMISKPLEFSPAPEFPDVRVQDLSAPARDEEWTFFISTERWRKVAPKISRVVKTVISSKWLDPCCDPFPVEISIFPELPNPTGHTVVGGIRLPADPTFDHTPLDVCSTTIQISQRYFQTVRGRILESFRYGTCVNSQLLNPAEVLARQVVVLKIVEDTGEVNSNVSVTYRERL